MKNDKKKVINGKILDISKLDIEAILRNADKLVGKQNRKQPKRVFHQKALFISQ